MRVLNAFVKPCTMEQGGARFNEFAAQNTAGRVAFAERFVLHWSVQVKIRSLAYFAVGYKYIKVW